ncbi:ribosome production factor 1 homolog [Cricetulus griseus]
MFTRWKQQRRKEKLAAKKKLKKEREALGDKAPPKPVPKTIDNQRVYDETTVDPTDEEVAYDEATDEFASYFNRQTSPKILITTSDRPHGRTVRLCEQLSTVIPDSHVYYRRGLALKKIIPQCIARDFTDLIVINEDRKTPNGLILSHLPNGPTAHFKMSSVRLRKEIKRRGKDPTEHVPEIILNNFTTRLGHSIGRMFASLFPHNPQFIGRQVATFHNQRDYIFFRFHRKEPLILNMENMNGSISHGKWIQVEENSIYKVLREVLNFAGQACLEKLASAEESQTAQNHGGSSELPGSLEESSNCFGNVKSPSLWKEEEDGGNTGVNKPQAKPVGDKEHITLPDLIDFPSFPSQRVSSRLTDSSLLKIEREKIIEQMKQVKEERKYLESIREDLIKKVEKLFEQNKSKRYHAGDNWKKKYFDTKKVTASLEEVLTKLREDLELYYKKLLMQLEAREIKMRPRNLANISDSKNYLIIQITEVQHAIDQLKRKLDTDKMKLILEVKMRKQAVSDLQTLKAELTQKKMTSFRSPLCRFI